MLPAKTTIWKSPDRLSQPRRWLMTAMGARSRPWRRGSMRISKRSLTRNIMFVRRCWTGRWSRKSIRLTLSRARMSLLGQPYLDGSRTCLVSIWWTGSSAIRVARPCGALVNRNSIRSAPTRARLLLQFRQLSAPSFPTARPITRRIRTLHTGLMVSACPSRVLSLLEGSNSATRSACSKNGRAPAPSRSGIATRACAGASATKSSTTRTASSSSAASTSTPHCAMLASASSRPSTATLPSTLPSFRRRLRSNF